MNALSVVLVAFTTSVITSAGTVYVLERSLASARRDIQQQTVPSLVGLTEADAKTNVVANGFSFMIAGREPSATAEPGSVVRQTPAAGQTSQTGKPISVTIALAPAKVPDVIGESVADATHVLQEAGYTVVVGAGAPSPEHVQGLVANQMPHAGELLDKKATVTLTPSLGNPEVPVPKVLGMTVEKAKTEIEKLGLKVKVQYVALAETATNIVLRQTPPADQKVKPDTEVTIVINQ
jgi:serine/threonine-protein kinase